MCSHAVSGGFGAASMLKGAPVVEAFGVYSAHRSGGSYFTSVFQGGVSGAAVAGAFGGVNTLTKGMNTLIQIGSKRFAANPILVICVLSMSISVIRGKKLSC